MKWSLLIYGEIMTQLLRKRRDANVPELASSHLVISELAEDAVIVKIKVRGFYRHKGRV